MAQVLKAGAIKVDIEANPKDFIEGFKEAVASLKDFGKEEEKVISQGKRLEDTLEDLQRRKKTLSKQLDETKEKYGENSVQVNKLEDRIANLNDRIDTQNIRLSEFGDSSNKMANAFEEAGDKMKFVASVVSTAVGNIIADAFSNATQAIIDFSKETLNSAMETEKQGIAFRVLTGGLDNSRRLMEEINNMAVKTPFNISEIRDLTKQMLAFGFSQEEVIPTMKMLGDITAGTGGDLTLLSRAFGQVKTKGKLYAQELNQLGEQGVAVREMLADSMGISVTDLMVGMEKKKISVEFEEFADIIKRLHKDKFFNLMAEQADSASGRVQNLGETLSLIGQEILGIDTLTGEIKPESFFDNFTKSLAQQLDFLREHKDAIINFFSGIYTNGKKVLGFFQTIAKENFDSVKKGFDSVFNAEVGEKIQKIMASVDDLFGAITGFKTDNKDGLSSYFETTGQMIARILLKVLDFIDITIDLITYIVDFSQKIINLYNQINSIISSIGGFFTTLWQNVLNFFNPLVAEIQRVLNEGFAYILGYILGFAIRLVGQLIWFLASMAINIYSFLFILGVEVGKFLLDLINQYIHWGIATRDSLIAKLGEFITFLSKLPFEILKFLQESLNYLLVELPKWGNAFGEMVQKLIRYLTTTPWHVIISDVMNLLSQGVKAGGKWVAEAFNNLLKISIDIFVKIPEWFVTFDWKKTMGDAVNSMIDGLLDNSQKLWGAGQKFADDFGRGFKDSLGIQSPSKFMIDAGFDISEGLDIGLQKGTLDVERRVSIMADTMIDEVSNKELKPMLKERGLTINQYGATISTTWIPSYAR